MVGGACEGVRDVEFVSTVAEGRVEGWTQFPAPPRPVWAYSEGEFGERGCWVSEGGWDSRVEGVWGVVVSIGSSLIFQGKNDVRKTKGHFDFGTYLLRCTRILNILLAIEVPRASTSDFSIGLRHCFLFIYILRGKVSFLCFRRDTKWARLFELNFYSRGAE